MGLKPGYKRTEVGVIPAEWEVRRLGETFRLINGCAFKPSDWRESGMPIIRIQNLNDPYAKFNYFQGPVAEENQVQPGDLLFAWSGTLGSSFGARLWSGPPGVLNQHIFKVLMDREAITLPFARLIFSRVEEDIAKRTHGFKASFVHIKKSDLIEVRLPLPPIQEQRAIATALSDVDALLTQLDRLIAKKRDIKQAAMQQLLTGKTRLPGFGGEWQPCAFDEVLERLNVKAHQLQTAEYQTVGRHPVVDQGQQPVVGYSDDGERRFVCPPGGVVVFGDHTCIVKFVDFDFLVGADGTQVLQARPGHSTRFLAYELQREGIQQTGYNRHFKFLKARRFKMPPLAEQTAIATLLSDLDAELAALEARRDKTRALKQGMMQELLTGRTRLV